MHNSFEKYFLTAVWLLLLTCCSSVFSQEAPAVKIETSDRAQQAELMNAIDSLNRSDSLGFIKSLSGLLRSRGLYRAQLRPRSKADSNYLILYPGPVLYQGDFRYELPAEYIMSETPQSNYAVLNPGSYAESFLAFLENNGRPFAQLELQSYFIRNDTLSGVWKINPGPERRWDSLVIKGIERVPASIIKLALDYNEGEVYRESYLSELPQRIAGVEYLEMARAPAVAFTAKKTTLFLYLNENKSNQIDGVLGLNNDEAGNVQLTGDIQLRLLNAFKRAEEFQLHWRSPGNEVQSLQLMLDLPYLFKTPLGWKNQLEIFRQDSSFINTGWSTQLKYQFTSRQFLWAGIDLQNSNDLSEGSDSLSSLSSVFYEIGAQLRQTNRTIAPYRGFQLTLGISSGTRTALEIEQAQYKFEFEGWQYFNPWSQHVFALGLRSQVLISENYFSNELFRIGGIQDLRGFNEQSIYSNGYGLATLEYRFRIGEYDYLSAFGDLAYSENRVNQLNSRWLSGLGVGINLQTAGGIFSLSFAVGKDQRSAYDLRATKVHFGYLNRF